METNSNDSNSHNTPNPNQSAPRPFARIASAMRTGAEDARKAAEEAMPRLKEAVASAAYWAAYGVSFAAVFEWTLLESGCRDGVKAGKAAATKWFEGAERASEGTVGRTAPLLPPPGASGPEPGVA